MIAVRGRNCVAQADDARGLILAPALSYSGGIGSVQRLLQDATTVPARARSCAATLFF